MRRDIERPEMPDEITPEWLAMVRSEGARPLPDDPSLIRVHADGPRGERQIIIARDDLHRARVADTEFIDGLAPPQAWVTTFDHIEWEPLQVAVGSCGLPACRCGLAWRPVPGAVAA